ncbi:MAG: Slp family lipoprotein [Gammaproteobacteria bacterium]
MTFYRPGFTILLMTLVACTSQVPQIIKTAPANNPQLQQVVDDPDKHLAQQVRWGGVILNTKNLQQSTRLTILAIALNDDGEPKTNGSSWGRFIANFSEFLEPSVYANGRMITIVGNIQNLETLKVGEYPYPHPVVRVTAHYLWPQPPASVNHDWPPFWYDPWYYPYPYPYPYYRPYRPHRP